MKTALVLLVACGTLSLAQDMKIVPKDAPQTPSDSREYRRLSSVTWDLDSHKLVWTVQKGAKVNGEFIPKSADRYEVSPSQAFMALKEEKREIGGDEAGSLFDLLSVLSLYCVQSTEWWENGGGLETPDKDAAPPAEVKPDGKDGKSVNRKADPDGAPIHIDQPDAKPDAKPAPKLLPNAMVASNARGK